MISPFSVPRTHQLDTQRDRNRENRGANFFIGVNRLFPAQILHPLTLPVATRDSSQGNCETLSPISRTFQLTQLTECSKCKCRHFTRKSVVVLGPLKNRKISGSENFLSTWLVEGWQLLLMNIYFFYSFLFICLGYPIGATLKGTL